LKFVKLNFVGDEQELADLDVRDLVNYSGSAEPGSDCLVHVGAGRLLIGQLLACHSEIAEVQLKHYPVRFQTPSARVFRLPDGHGLLSTNTSTTAVTNHDQLIKPEDVHIWGAADVSNPSICVQNLNHVKILAGQQCFFLGFGESSKLVRLKPIYEEEDEEGDLLELERIMLEACTLPTLKHPPSVGQIVSVPRQYTNYIKYIR
jgi:hypothetical protein